MAEVTQTFSESWYRIANQRISLRAGVKVRRQNFRGQRWIVLENPFSNQFFRLRPAAYEFVARLRPDRTVQEVWKECLDRFPDEAPGQEAVIQLLSQLYFSNLLQYDLAADSAKLFERYERTKQRETRARLLSIMFMRFPLLDPDEFLARTMSVVGKLITPIGGLIWLLVVGWALKVVMDHFPELRDQSQGILAPSNLVLLYVGMVIIKTLHEFGHAYFCKKFGGEVHVMGVMLLIFTPVPYMDATSSWGFRSRWKRILVGAAGMIVEVFVAALATFVWANTSPGIVHSLAYNMMFIASVSTVVFNLIPLMRFDGYYILSDLLDIPNLHQRSLLQLRHWIEHYVFAVKKSESPAQGRREAGWLVAFGISSGIYRIVVFGRILLFLADQLLLIGIIMAVICAIAWVLVPTIKLFNYLGSNPRLERNRPRAVAITAGFVAALILLLQVVPFPNHFRAPGVLECRQWVQVINESPGYVDTLLAPPGAPVTQGQPLVQFRNHELDLELAAAQASYAEIQARILQAMKTDSANLKPLTSRLETINKRLQRIESDRANLTVKARQNGVWVAPQMEEAVGRWLARGTALGLIVDPSAFEFVATVVQEDVDSLFNHGIRPNAQVRLFGQAEAVIPAANFRKIPAEHRILPSPALGWAGGGEMAIAPNDPQGQKAAEPFFEVRADVQPAASSALLHGRAGKIRFDLEPEPLLPRWARRFRQLIQKRYQL
ncbi:MAG: hypothetical protein HY674_03130 [Chloroflexi bacterium]|nr:hypothetical protein [Chloroflexota bacterium]